MIKQNRLKIIVSFLITAIPLIVGLILWNKLPDKIATNFDWNGNVSGYSSKMFTVLGLPLILITANFVCIIATSADPKIKNISKGLFSVIISIIPVCSLFCSMAIYTYALGYDFNMKNITSVMLGVMFVVLGFVLPKCKQNYTVGIKLPWTLHDESNWNSTHHLAGHLWIAGGIIMIIAGILKLEILYISIVLILAIIPTVYSYVLYRRKSK